MANNFKIFAPDTTNIRSDNEYNSLNERINGFQPQTVISSSTMNTVLRQNSLISYAIAQMIVDGGYATGDIGPNSNPTTFQTAFENFMKGYFKKELGLDVMSNPSIPYWNGSKLIGLTPSGDERILGVYSDESTPRWIQWSQLRAGTASTASTAFALTGFENKSQGTTVAFSFGLEGYKTEFSHQITVDVPGSVESASNVTTSIAGKLITAIFESNGTTVKNATLAASATNIAGGTAGSIPYQIGSGSTSYLSKPATTSPYFLQMTSAGTPSWVLNANMTVGSATNAGSANTLNMTSYNVGSIPYKNINGEYGVILPPSSTDSSEEFVLVSKYSGSGGQVPAWQSRQKITVVENGDGTVDVTITNV